ncbi:MAG TPA: sigma-70 family RNA polymerase sigma factor [Chitinophagaceae bacterium]
MNSSTGQNTTDRQLVDRVLAGERHAFGMIIKNTGNLVAKIIFDMILNDDDRKDIAQDVYLKVYQKLPGFKFQSKLSTWIGQICYNTCVDHLRKKKLVLVGNFFQTETESSNDLLDTMNTAQGNFDEPVDTFVIGKDITGIVKMKIEKLPPVYKTLIGLFHNEELSYDEIGEITGLPAGTVKSYLFRARKQLKNELLLHYKKEDIW